MTIDGRLVPAGKNVTPHPNASQLARWSVAFGMITVSEPARVATTEPFWVRKSNAPFCDAVTCAAGPRSIVAERSGVPSLAIGVAFRSPLMFMYAVKPELLGTTTGRSL